MPTGELNYLKKEDYGKVPEYLSKVRFYRSFLSSLGPYSATRRLWRLHRSLCVPDYSTLTLLPRVIMTINNLKCVCVGQGRDPPREGHDRQVREGAAGRGGKGAFPRGAPGGCQCVVDGVSWY